jgi:hypothetical protein
VAENFLKTSETTQADYAAVRRVDPDSDREAEVFVRLCDELFQGGKNKARNFRPSDELLTWAKGMGFTLPFNKAIRSLIDRSPQADGSDLALVMGIDLHDATSSDSEVTRLYFTVPAQDSAEDLAALDTGTIGVDRLGPVFLAVSGVRDKGELHPSSVHMYDIVPAQQAAA